MPGLEVQAGSSSDFAESLDEKGPWSPLLLKWSGDIPLGDQGIDSQPGVHRSLAEGPALVQFLLDSGSVRSKDGLLSGFWLSGRIVCIGKARRRRLAEIYHLIFFHRL